MTAYDIIEERIEYTGDWEKDYKVLREKSDAKNKAVQDLFKAGEKTQIELGSDEFIMFSDKPLTARRSAEINTSTAFGKYLWDVDLANSELTSMKDWNPLRNLFQYQAMMADRIVELATRARDFGSRTIVIVNAQIGAALQDCDGFRMAPMEPSGVSLSGNIYKVGTLAGFDLYVEPNMCWDDTRICIHSIGEPGFVLTTGVFMASILGPLV